MFFKLSNPKNTTLLLKIAHTQLNLYPTLGIYLDYVFEGLALGQTKWETM